MNKRCILSLSVPFVLSASAALAADASVLFVLDGSGSMQAKIDNKRKIEVARTVMSNLVKSLPANVRIGLETYGRNRKDDCKDIEMLAPVGSDRATIIKAVNDLDPKGSTPLSGAIRLAAEQLRETEGSASVVVVSDGKESCEGDPCAAVREAIASGVKMHVHVVGFDVAADEAEQLRCIAKEGNGKYFAATNANELGTALAQVKEEVVAPAPLTPKPAEVTDKSRAVQAHTDIDDPLAIELGMTSKLTLDANEQSYFKISLPGDEIKVILDMRRSDGKHSNLQSRLSLLDQDGSIIKDNIIHLNEIDVGYRAVSNFSMKTPQELRFKLANDDVKAMFWLTVVKAADSAPLPFFGKVMPTVIAEGQTTSGALDTNEFTYYSIPLKKGDYKALLDFKNSAGKNTNLQGYLALLNADGGNQQEIIRMNKIDVSYRESSAFSVKEDQSAIIRVENTSDPVKYTIKISPVTRE